MQYDSMAGVAREFLQSAPIKVHMAGFQSTTTALQANGWQLSVESQRAMMYDSVDLRMAFKHDGIKQVAMGIIHLDHRGMMSQLSNPRGFLSFLEYSEIHIRYIAPMVRCIDVPTMGIGSFHAIDARPEFSSMPKDLADLAMFKPIKTDSNFELYIHEKDEQEILDFLLKKQDPRQKEIRQNQKRRQYFEESAGITDQSLNDKINTDIKHQIVLVA